MSKDWYKLCWDKIMSDVVFPTSDVIFSKSDVVFLMSDVFLFYMVLCGAGRLVPVLFYGIILV